MIAKKIAKNPAVSDSFKALAEYIAGAPEKGEKLEDLWISNCDAGSGPEDLTAAVAEVEATRGRAAPAQNKSYHLMVSFRPGERPSLEELKDIEHGFAEALGFGGHQRIAGTHADTDHFHMHVAINRVHPETLKVHSPWKDYKVLETTCRAMERKHGLQVDLGRTDYVDYGKFRNVVSPAARNFEASTWRQSFQSHVLDDKERIVKTAGKARDWQDLHKGLAKLDLEIVLRGRGFALKQTGGREAIKASLVDRSLSHNELKKRLGSFEPATSKAKPKSRYRGRPLGRHPGVSRLWRTFLGQRKRPKTLLGRIAADWKQFLMNEAYRDPMALVVIITYKEMFRAVFGEGAARMPRILRLTLRHWMEAGKWADGKSSPWLGQKGKTRGLGLKEDGDGNLLVPFRDKNGHVWSLQVLKPDGKTTEIGDLGRKGLLHVIDPGERIEKAEKPPAVVLTDDLASAAAIRGASRVPVALLPPDGNMKAAVKSLRAQRPDCTVVVAGGASLVQRAGAAGIDAVEIKKSEHGRPVLDALKHNNLRAKLAPLTGDKGFEAWMELKDAPWADPGNAPWLMKNGVRGFGLKSAPDGGVAMPLKDAYGRLYDVKLVSPDGVSRRAAPDGDAPPLMHLIDPKRRAAKDTIIVTGDYLSGAAVHKATRLPVAVAEEPGRIGEAAGALRGRYPDIKLVIAADKEQAGNLKEPARESRAVLVSPPEGAVSFAERPADPDGIRAVLAHAAGDTVFLRWRAAEPLGKDAPEELPPGLPREGLRRDKKTGRVLVPLIDEGGRIFDLCAVNGRGEIEERMARVQTPGLAHVVGKEKSDAGGGAVIAGDLASAAAIHEATGRPALCAFGSRNLKAVARAWRGKHPQAEIAVAATNNNAAARNVSADNAAAAARAVGGELIAPSLTESDKAEGRTSFGDLWRDESRRWEVRGQLEGLAGKDKDHGIEF